MLMERPHAIIESRNLCSKIRAIQAKPTGPLAIHLNHSKPGRPPQPPLAPPSQLDADGGEGLNGLWIPLSQGSLDFPIRKLRLTSGFH